MMTRAWKDTVQDLLSWVPPKGVHLTFRADSRAAEVLVRLVAGEAFVDVTVTPGPRAETFAGLDEAAAACLEAAICVAECYFSGGCDHCRVRVAVEQAGAVLEGFCAGRAIARRKGA